MHRDGFTGTNAHSGPVTSVGSTDCEEKKMEASLRRKKCLPLVPALSCTGAPELWKPVSSTGEQHPCRPQETSVHSDNAGVQEEASSAAPLASDTIVVVCQS